MEGVDCAKQMTLAPLQTQKKNFSCFREAGKLVRKGLGIKSFIYILHIYKIYKQLRISQLPSFVTKLNYLTKVVFFPLKNSLSIRFYGHVNVKFC